MKRIAALSLSSLIFAACGNSNQPTVSSNAVPPPAVQNTSNSLVVSSHSTDKTAPAPPADANSNASRPPGNSPMSKPIDVSAMTAKIEKAEKEQKAAPADAKAKENLAAAYFERAFALTEAAQYRAALGDFRKGLKLKPDDKEAKAMHDQIIDIFKSIGREPPKEGEEPPPLPFKKEA